MKNYLVSTLVIIFIGFFNSTAKENVPNPNDSDTNNYRIIAAGCLAATAQTELNVNNVRTTILAGGDMWWDLDNGKYEIPNGGGKHSMFAGALWIGGLDDQGNLKVAGMTYRQDGNDFWPGPLNADVASDDYGTIGADVCSDFDKHFVVTRQEVEDYVGYNTCLSDPNCDVSVSYPNYTQAPIISDWPASRVDIDGTFDYLAPFEDVNADGIYTVGIDYPGYDLEGVKDCKSDDVLFGDQTLWWVFNDNGNIHTETGSESAIGLEIQAQAFGFTTNDEINNMTFYSYKIINRSSSVLNEAYFGQWVDPDLGNYQDDYVGCDVSLGLGYCYNGDADDDGTAGYNYDSDDPPPAIGVDFFRGPLADIGDGVDNDKDGVIDEEGEQIIMSKFVYYNNDFSDFGNPENATHYYGYLKGIWKNGQPMTYGGTGWESSNPECNFMFPDDTDPDFSPLYGSWTEITAGNDPADRRFLQSAGPFTLEPGAVNYITTGVVWARASEGNNFASVELMKIADNKAQTLFDICFEVIDGPSAPDINFVELDEKIIINLTNAENSNNYANQYVEQDPFISNVLQVEVIGYSYDTIINSEGQEVLVNPSPIYNDSNLPIDKNYRFEGYQVFQLRDATVTSNDLYNPDKAFMVYQCDVENYRTADGEIVSIPTEDATPIANLVNYSLDESIGPNVYLPQNMTLGAANSGINNSFMITEDRFATGDPGLINNKPYYYMAIAYAYNEYIPYSPEVAFTASSPYTASNAGQKKPYLAGRKNIKTYTIIPHKIESFGDVPTASYGAMPAQTGLAGRGNGGNFLEITAASRNEIATNFFARELSYKMNSGPAMISVVDPLSVPDADFVFKVIDVEVDNDGVLTNAKWSLTKIENGDSVTVESQNSLIDNAQQILSDWGLGVTFKSIPSLESGLVDNLGCLSCSGWFTVTNSELEEIIWTAMDNGSTADNISEVVNSDEYQDLATSTLWVYPTPDVDDVWQFVPFMRPLDWVRSGNNSFSESDGVLAPYHYYGDISVNGTQLNSTGTTDQQTPLDPNGIHEGQALVPYKLVSTDYRGRVGASTTTNVINFIDTVGGGLAWYDWKTESSLDNLNNVDVVLTSNKDLWTRCPVLDMSEGALEWVGQGDPVDQSNGVTWPFGTSPSSSSYPWASSSSGAIELTPTGENETSFNDGDGASKWDLRLAPNVDKDGNSDGTGSGFNSENGWGWFPGYAVDVSTGKRLNLMFSENSSLGNLHNGNDMIYNPTSYLFDYGTSNTVGFGNMDDITTVTMNGGHAVFVLDTEYQGDNPEDNPHYASYTGSSENNAWNSLRKKQVIPHIQWVGNWWANPDKNWLPENDDIVIRARVQENYGYRDRVVEFTNVNPESLEFLAEADIDGDGDFNWLDEDMDGDEIVNEADNDTDGDGIEDDEDDTPNGCENPEDCSELIPSTTTLEPTNDGYPYYRFNSADIFTILDDAETKKAGLEQVNVVPNPYYGASGYETGQVDNRVKITNLPKECTISIYTINGNLIRQIQKDNQDPAIEWDLKNNYGIPIASGMYIIHIDAGDVGEKVLKWFGALRPTDLDSF
jgi:hypothetical protein